MERTPALNEFLAIHYQAKDGLRLGQRFVNYYIKQAWPELFYAQKDTAQLIIYNWLNDHHYVNSLPKKLDRE